MPTKKTWRKKLTFLLLIHHPVTALILCLVDFPCANWTKAQRLMLQMRRSIGSRILLLVTEICSVAFVLMVLIESDGQCLEVPAGVSCSETSCSLRFEPCDDSYSKYCCLAKADGIRQVFTAGWMVRQLLIQILCVLLHLPLRRLVPFFLDALQNSFQSVTRPLERKQAPGASLAYILVRNAFYFCKYTRILPDVMYLHSH